MNGNSTNGARTGLLAAASVFLMFAAMPANAAYSLVFSDEFAGNLSQWTHQTGATGWGNSEKQNYTNGANSSIINDAAATDGKALRITLTGGPNNYTSSRLNSNAYFTRGQLEFRAKHTQAAGFWPALWMLGQNLRSNGTVWPATGEIDVMEMRNTENTNYGTMHWDLNGYQFWGGSTGASATAYTTYSILWTDQFIRWFVNGVQYVEGNIAGSVNGTDEFHRPFYILMNFAACSTASGFCAGQQATAGSGTMEIDYVRLYQDPTIPGTTCSGCTGSSSGGSSSSSSSSSSGGGVTIQENTTSFCGVNGVIATQWTGYSGAGYADTTNAVGSAVSWQVNIPTAGNYTVSWRYANGGTDNRNVNVQVDGFTKLSNVAFPPTGAWGTWSTITQTVSITNPGSHRFRIAATTATGTANIDRFYVGQGATGALCQ